MLGTKNPRDTLAFLLFSVLAFLSPALFNGYPIVFADTGVYIQCSFTHCVPIDRPVFYSLFLEAVQLNHTVRSLWGVVLAQVLCCSLLLFVFFRQLDLPVARSPWWRLAVVLVLTLATSLPWFLNWVTPDMFAGILALSMYLIVFRWNRMNWWEKTVSGLGFYGSALVHTSHLLIASAIIIGVLLVRSARRRAKLAPVLALAALSFASAIGVNALLTGSPSLSRAGHVFIINRLTENGILYRLLSEHCEDQGYALCPYKEQIRSLGQDEYTWAPDSPVNEIGGKEGSREASLRMILHSIRYYPMQHVWETVKASIDQLTSFRTGYGMYSYSERRFAVHTRIARFYRNEYDDFLAARQQRGLLFPVARGFGLLHLVAGYASVVILLVIYLAERGRARPTGSGDRAFALFTFAFVVVNALLCGSLNTVVDRYQSRVAWLLTLAAIVAVSGWMTRAGTGEGPP